MSTIILKELSGTKRPKDVNKVIKVGIGDRIAKTFKSSDGLTIWTEYVSFRRVGIESFESCWVTYKQGFRPSTFHEWECRIAWGDLAEIA